MLVMKSQFIWNSLLISKKLKSIKEINTERKVQRDINEKVRCAGRFRTRADQDELSWPMGQSMALTTHPPSKTHTVPTLTYPHRLRTLAVLLQILTSLLPYAILFVPWVASEYINSVILLPNRVLIHTAGETESIVSHSIQWHYNYALAKGIRRTYGPCEARTRASPYRTPTILPKVKSKCQHTIAM